MSGDIHFFLNLEVFTFLHHDKLFGYFEVKLPNDNLSTYYIPPKYLNIIMYDTEKSYILEEKFVKSSYCMLHLLIVVFTEFLIDRKIV